MFDGYRQLLKIVCCKEWNADKNHELVNNFLNTLKNILATDMKSLAFLNLVSKLLQKAFDEDDDDLLRFALSAIIEFDEILEGEKPERKIEDEMKSTVEKEKVSEEQIVKEGEVLSRSYGTLIKKSAVKEILSKIRKDFSLSDLEEVVANYYRNVMKSRVNDKGLQIYANSYKRFFLDFGLCRRDDVPERPPPEKSVAVYHLTNKNIEDIKKPEKAQKIIGRSALSNNAKYIMLWAEKNATDVLDVDAVYKHKLHPIGENYHIRDIYAGLDELVEKGRATRFGKKRYGIKREMLKK